MCFPFVEFETPININHFLKLFNFFIMMMMMMIYSTPNFVTD